MTDEIPRLFQLRTGDQLAEVIAHGVQWPEGTITVRWVKPEPATEQWDDFNDPGAAIVHTEQMTVMWLRQDTYADTPAEPAPKEPGEA